MLFWYSCSIDSFNLSFPLPFETLTNCHFVCASLHFNIHVTTEILDFINIIILMILKLLQINLRYSLTILQSLANQIYKFSLKTIKHIVLHNHFLVSKLNYEHSITALYFSVNKYQKKSKYKRGETNKSERPLHHH